MGPAPMTSTWDPIDDDHQGDSHDIKQGNDDHRCNVNDDQPGNDVYHKHDDHNGKRCNFFGVFCLFICISM